MTKLEIIKEMYPDEPIILADGFDDAIMGVARVFNKIIALYDEAECIRILVNRDGMAVTDAMEYFDVNVVGSYLGEQTPAFAVLVDPIDEYPEARLD